MLKLMLALVAALAALFVPNTASASPALDTGSVSYIHNSADRGKEEIIISYDAGRHVMVETTSGVIGTVSNLDGSMWCVAGKTDTLNTATEALATFRVDSTWYAEGTSLVSGYKYIDDTTNAKAQCYVANTNS